MTDPIHLARAVVRRAALLRAAARWLLGRSPRLRRAVQLRLTARADAAYRDWLAGQPSPAVPDAPPVLISVVMPVFDPREDWFRAAIASVRAQSWPHWELCLADDASTQPQVARVLAELAGDPRIRIVRRTANGHISAASNSALALATGAFVALMDHDDLLPPHALARVAAEIAAHPQAALIYSDEDQIDGHGRRCQPAFKPDFDPDLLLARNLVSHLGVYRRDLLVAIGGFREGFEGSQDHDLALRIAARVPATHIRHIPEVLYSWRQAGASSFSERWLAKCADASRRAVADHLVETGTVGTATAHPLVPAAVRVLRPLPDPPRVSVIVPTRDRADLLARCADGVLHRTDYPSLELLVMDNGSREAGTAGLLVRLAGDARVTVLRDDGDFNFARLCNTGVGLARGDIVLLLNNDVEIINPAWLRELVAHAVRPEIGAVGAKLLYPNRRVQHAGIVLGAGPDGVAAHAFTGADGDAAGPGAALLLEREVGAVTAACLAVRRDAYLAVDGMDAANLPVAYNDVDVCLRLRAAGLRNLWTPFAVLMHHESATRGSDTTSDRLRREAAFMRDRWGAALTDPFYNPNFSRTALHHLREHS